MKPTPDPEKRNPAGRPGFEGVQTTGSGPHENSNATPITTSTMPSVDIVLSRLDRVRKNGAGWTARCPAHEDKTASLSIAVGNDGRLLLHCFAMCGIHDVLGSIGLSVSDLFPRRLVDSTPEQRREARRHALQTHTVAAAGVLEREAVVVELCASDLAKGLPLDEASQARLALAQERIAAARQVLAGGRHD